MDEDTIQTINDILKRGHDVQIQKKDDGYIILEVQKKIRYRSSEQWGSGEGQ